MIASVTLTSKKERRLGILSFEDYSIKKVETYSKTGIYNVDIYVNDNYDLYINGIKIKLKSIFKPIKIELPDEAYIKRFFSDLTSSRELEFIEIGPLAFKKEELKYAYYIIKEIKNG